MREIRFRAWIYSKNKMTYPDGIIFERLTEDHELMQYTGLKDKNGKEIWEGDIVRVHNQYSGGVHQWPVEFKKGGFWPVGELDEYGAFEWVNTEIIGNIYENKELLDEA